MRTRIALVAITSIAVITVTLLTQAVAMQPARASIRPPQRSTTPVTGRSGDHLAADITPATVKAGKLFLNDELSHAGDLAGLVRAAGGKPIKPRPSYPLGAPHGSAEVLGVLHTVEQALITAYLDAIPRLRPGTVKQQVASILANDAQHVAVVRAALGRPAIPSAFVTGRE